MQYDFEAWHSGYISFCLFLSETMFTICCSCECECVSFSIALFLMNSESVCTSSDVVAILLPFTRGLSRIFIRQFYVQIITEFNYFDSNSELKSRNNTWNRPVSTGPWHDLNSIEFVWIRFEFVKFRSISNLPYAPRSLIPSTNGFRVILLTTFFAIYCSYEMNISVSRKTKLCRMISGWFQFELKLIKLDYYGIRLNCSCLSDVFIVCPKFKWCETLIRVSCVEHWKSQMWFVRQSFMRMCSRKKVASCSVLIEAFS